MERRTFLRTVGAGAGALAGGGAVVTANGDDETEKNPTPADGSEAYVPKVNEIRSPLAGVPEVVVAGDEPRVELGAEAVKNPGTATAYLEPSFGGPARIGLQRVDADEYDDSEDPEGRSRIWNEAEGESEAVHIVKFRIPSLGSSDAFTPDLYDLVVTWDGGEDRQPRAVSVRREVPEELDVAVIADPQIGDFRGVQSGFEESRGKESPEPFLRRAQGVTGDRPGNRWAATKRAIAEVNALDPDIVLGAGDLCLGQDLPGKFYAEYEDAWDVMNQVRAPTFITCGNHDAYVQSGTDGKALYRETFGPPSYSVAVGDAAQVVAVDTYDWSYLDRTGASVAVSTFGGQVQQPQFDWLRGELARVAATDRSILAFGHHNPSWIPDRRNRYYEETDGEPVFEQAARGSRFGDPGRDSSQRWTGENAFALRRLFDGAGVDAFFCGHSHRDRLARSMEGRDTSPELVEDGDGPRIANVTAGCDLDRGGEDDGYGNGNYADVVAALGNGYVRQRYTDDVPVRKKRVENYPIPGPKTLAETPVRNIRDTSSGTLYVNVASTMSSTDEYWGWRRFDYDTNEEGLDPVAFQYPMDQPFLDDRAVDPDIWDPELDEVGLFSTPSYLLDVTRAGSANSPDGRTVTITNDQTVARRGAVTVSTTAQNPTVESDDESVAVVWRRDAGQRTDIKVAFDVEKREEGGESGETSLLGTGEREEDDGSGRTRFTVTASEPPGNSGNAGG
jgi:hypothetical protein